MLLLHSFFIVSEMRACDQCRIMFPVTDDLKPDENLCIKHRNIRDNGEQKI